MPCDFGVCNPIGNGFQSGALALPAGTLGLGICTLTPGCQDALLAGALYVGLVAATHYFAQKRDIQFARDVARAVEKICGPGRVTPDQIHDLLHWGHYGSFGEAVNDIAAIVCPEKAGGAR